MMSPLLENAIQPSELTGLFSRSGNPSFRIYNQIVHPSSECCLMPGWEGGGVGHVSLVTLGPVSPESRARTKRHHPKPDRGADVLEFHMVAMP
jgi:hypothetical protein